MISYLVSFVRGKWVGSRLWQGISRRLQMASRCHIALIIVFVGLVACVSPLAAFLSRSNPSEGENIEDPLPLDPTWFVSRKQWLAVKPSHVNPLSKPQRIVIIAHTATETCHNRDECASVVRHIQHQHMHVNNFSDIAYNFLVGGDGRVYEGVGWGVRGSHTGTCNTNCTGVAFIGDYRSKFSNAKPISDQVKYLNRLLDIGKTNGNLTTSYSVIPQCQAQASESPGDNLFNVMVTWPRYSATAGDFHLVCHWG